MEKFIGNLDSKKSGAIYPVFWNSEEKTVWRILLYDWKEMIAYNVLDEISAYRIAREFLDLQI